VTTFTRGADALKALRERRGDFDIVLSDVHMPDMDGFKLLEHIALELDVPVMMMSANCATDVVLRGIIHGAVDYLLKPVRIEELRNIWQHVVRKKRVDDGGADGASAGSGDADAASEGSLEGSRGAHKKTSSGNPVTRKGRAAARADGSPGRSNGAGEDTAGKKRARKTYARDDDRPDATNGVETAPGSNGFNGKTNEPNEEGHEDSSALKKPRVVWSAELHQQFVTAVNTLGIDKAVPKRILDLMGVQGLTRENVASHLQKYRLYLKRLQGVNNGAGGPGGGGSPGFMTGLAVDHAGVVVGAPNQVGAGRVGSPAMAHAGPGGGVVMGVGLDAMNGGMHHPQMMAPGVMYQMTPGPNGMIAIPGVHSGPPGSVGVDAQNGGGGKEAKDAGRGYGMGGSMGSMGSMGSGMGMGMMPGSMVPAGMHHVHSNGAMHPHAGVMMAPVGMATGGYAGPGDQNGARAGAGYAYPVGAGGALVGPGGGLDGADISGKALGSLGGDLGDDAVLDMFLKDGLPEGDGF